MKIETRMSAKSPKIETDVTLDFTGVSPEKMREWATRTVVISCQRVWRDAGHIPPKAAIKVAEFMDGKGRPERLVTPEKVLAAAEKMSPEAVADLIKRLQAKKK